MRDTHFEENRNKAFARLFQSVSNVRTRGHKLIGRKGISKIPKQRRNPQQIHAAVFVDARRRSGTTWFTKGLDNYLLLGANPASPAAAGRHWPSACLHFAFVWLRRTTLLRLVSLPWRNVRSAGFKCFNCSLCFSQGIAARLTTNKLKYQPKRGHGAHWWNNGQQVVEGFVFRKAQEARSDKSDFCKRAKTVRMKSWGSVVAELTFLNKPWDLSLDRHSSSTFMPERLPVPLDAESLNKKHIFYDRAYVSSRSCLKLPPPVSLWYMIVTIHLLHHTQASKLSLNTFQQPLISSSCQIIEIKGLRAKWGAQCTNFHVHVTAAWSSSSETSGDSLRVETG